MSVEKANFAFRHKFLQLLIRHERKVHAIRIRAYQHHVLKKHQIDGRFKQLAYLNRSQGGLPILRPCAVYFSYPRLALHRMRTGNGHKPWVFPGYEYRTGTRLELSVGPF